MNNLRNSNIILLPTLIFSSFFLIFLFYETPNLHLLIMTKLQPQTSIISPDSSTFDPLKMPTDRKVRKLGKREQLELGLARARAAIRKAVLDGNVSSIRGLQKGGGYEHRGDIYRNEATFYRSYIEMEKRFKIFVYEEGEAPLVHAGPCKSTYNIEGRFIHELELRNTHFLTRDPTQAHVFFMPFSVANMVHFIYKPLSYDHTPLHRFVSDYIQVISNKYPFWNASSGADHFMLSCHDWGPHASRANPYLYNTSIRVLCNANTSEGFNPIKDVTLPETISQTGDISLQFISDPPESTPNHHKSIAFFAGGNHGPIRSLLLHHWKEKDPKVLVYEYLPQGLDYYTLMHASKYCLCPSGYEVATPRIAEAIYEDCVPVIISEHYVLPFSDVLRWEAFSVHVAVRDIPRIKSILSGIGEEEYMRLKEGLRAVKGHFVLNQPAERFDAFHMILHSIWLRRLNIKLM